MKKRYLLGSRFLLIALSCTLSSCDPVYIPDPIDPRLPKYTDDGNNVAGALINGTLWKSEYFIGLLGSTDAPYLSYSSSQDSLSITFYGNIDTTDKDNRISFGLRGFGVSSLASMTKFHGQKITLDGTTNVASLNFASDSDCLATGIGQIYFRSVKYNSQNSSVTISGTFGFDVDDPICGRAVVTYGRFDFSVSDFYSM